MLTVSTPIPTSLRGRIRALVKAHAGWHGFLSEKGIVSASARNADLLEFALRHPTLTSWIEQMLAEHTAARIEALLRSFSEARRRRAEELAAYAARSKTKAIEDQMNDFNWVGSRHHY